MGCKLQRKIKDRKTILAIGNKGGDYLNIQACSEEDLLEVEVGHCCVRTTHHILPVEILTLVLHDVDELKERLRNSGWEKEFVETLIKKIKPIVF